MISPVVFVKPGGFKDYRLLKRIIPGKGTRLAKKKKTLSIPNPMGRPSDYNPEYCQQLIDHMAQGYSFESFAGRLLKSKQTLYTWIEKHQDFMDAKNIADMACLFTWEAWNIQGVYSTDGVKANTGLIAFNMKNRFKWRDQHEVITEIKHEGAEEVKELVNWLKSVREIE